MSFGRNVIPLSDPALLERVDRLRELNISQRVPLPQLVVVGDQGSGKSSLLESLSGLPFPKDQSLCTRYATQITSRRNDIESVEMRIISGPNASEDHKKNLEVFQRKEPSTSAFREKFVDILKKVNDKMGLRSDISNGNGPVFSKDVLKIEMQGPNEDYLTIIDVPGIFRNTTTGTTTKDDMVMVKNLVKRYIKDHRTIILAVLPSNVDIATQEILELAADYDKTGERTLGVLTKPDLVTETSAQAAVKDLVLGKKRPLTLGYFLVCNRGADSNSNERPNLDEIFQQPPWSELPEDRVGISALKAQLSTLLMWITRREFPKLIQDVQSRSKEYMKDRDNLGPSRQDEREQRRFLIQLAEKFQDRTRAALTADYNAHTTFDQNEFRLITHVVNITDVYSDDFQRNAHSRHFENNEHPTILIATNPEDEYCDSVDTPTLSLTEKLRKLVCKAKVDDLTTMESSELGDIMISDSVRRTPVPRDDISLWIKDIYLQSRGMDLGTFNANMVSTAFAEQSRKWEDMTKVYLTRIIVTIHRFMSSVLQSICLDEQIHTQIRSAILENVVDCYKEAMVQASLLMEVERRRKPYTLNRRFTEDLSKSRAYRIRESLRPRARKDISQYGETQLLVNLDDIPKAAAEISNAEQLQDEIHDILQSYYGLAADRFIDNIFQITVDYHLLHGPSSPLKVFTPDWVINLEPDELDRIVGETPSAKKYRQKLTNKIDHLNNAMKILRT